MLQIRFIKKWKHNTYLFFNSFQVVCGPFVELMIKAGEKGQSLEKSGT